MMDEMAKMLLDYISQGWTAPEQLTFVKLPTRKNDWLWDLDAQEFRGQVEFEGMVISFRLGKDANGQWEREMREEEVEKK